MSIITTVLAILCGVALFLFGMSLMGNGLQRVAGNSLEKVLFKLTSTPIKGVLLGAAVTAVIQSSSATSVMVVGFVNAGMMQIAQGIGVIMGANIGTSITGWILCLSYIDGSSGIASLLSTATISAVVAVIGVILRLFTKHTKYHNIGDIMVGFAILMVGMQQMSGAVAPLKDNENFVSILTAFTNPLLGILVGILFTAILQSASASVGVLQALSVTGAITFQSAFPIILGIGIGASVPVLISGIGTNTNAKRTALVYLVNDMLGCIICGGIFYIVAAFVDIPFISTSMTPVMIALINTVYRIVTVILLFPFVKAIEKLVCFLIKDKKEESEEQADFELLEERFLTIPELAISQSHKCINGMARTAQKNISRATSMVDDYSESKFNKVCKKEDILDKYEDHLGTYLMRVSKTQMDLKQSKQVSKFLHTIGDFERLGDHAMNIAFVSQTMVQKDIEFSEEAYEELDVIKAASEEIVDIAVSSFQVDDANKATQVEPLREWIGKICDNSRSNHVTRLQAGQCEIKTGVVFNDLIMNYERIAAHCSNIAAATIEADQSHFNTHEMISEIRHNKDNDYQFAYKTYAEKFALEEPDEEKKKRRSRLKKSAN
ncbi:MAG: Na/Pi cotransporter family protein [Lachnospiraceae bacterium]|nr:Na/Pi cotransporter family protein [Lachnospiraceae bacterium]